MCNDKDQGGMGFKDLTMFNEAMLEKLSWRLLQKDNSLFFRVFKARFLSNGTILDAKDSASASYAWKSILKGREVILKGALWRVGDGKQIKIWGDNWLPTKILPKIISPMIFGQQNSSVEVLINQSTQSWREEEIDHYFSMAKAAIIKIIPLSSSPQRDTLIWPTGPYSDKSGYRLFYEGSSINSPTHHAST